MLPVKRRLVFKRYLQRESSEKGFLLITTEHHISPNQARNLGLKEVKTKYVVFIDNDALVTPGWLEALVRCAEETGAWVVGPLCLIGEIGAGVVHVAGGNVHFKDEIGGEGFVRRAKSFQYADSRIKRPAGKKTL